MSLKVNGLISALAMLLVAKLVSKLENDLVNVPKESQLITKSVAVEKLPSAKLAVANAIIIPNPGQAGLLVSAKWRTLSDRASENATVAMTLCLLLRLRPVHR